MEVFPHQVVCEHCDSVYRRRPLARGEIAHCERCGAVLYRAARLSIDQWLALTVAAAIMFVLSNVYPVIRISLKGLHNEATLWQAVSALAHGAVAPIAVPAAFTFIVVPFLQITLLLWILAYVRLEKYPPGFSLLMKTLNQLRGWSMVEVCMLGVLVAVIKLSNFLDVVVGIGTWALAALNVLIIIIASRNTHWLWELVEQYQTDPAAAHISSQAQDVASRQTP
ncbi:paraquat-inducible protein A [Herminiimonas arsenitoxidans]|uniref:paraquat-inducible protein A n=1 Tax=Herminiimonas arsenitoxidans TaxID=1809410 RepID=UPI000971450F|nr:paraquat-inducible protein A [Herminiimonas arsenitoxidans]